MKLPIRTLAAIAGLAVAACSSGGSNELNELAGSPAAVSHIHGLGVDAAGALFVATHTGLIKRDGDDWVYASNDTNDHMGFSMHAQDGIMFRSGHSFQRPSLGVESSTDGADWSHLADVTDPPADFHAMAVSYADSKTLWGWGSGLGIYRSDDGAMTWTRLDTKSIENQVYVLAGPASDGVVLAGTKDGLHRSTDSGETWSRIDKASTGWVTAIAADPRDNDHLLVFTPEGMRTTRDGGRSWTPATEGLPLEEIGQVAISPLDGMVAYAATSDRIYETTNGGTTWKEIPTR